MGWSWIKKLTSSDHRKAPRTESPLLVAYYWDGSVPMSHEIRNISATGFYLLTRERWHPGTVVTMTLQRTAGAKENSDTEHYISVLSKVVRLGQDGVGFAFVPLEAKDSNPAKGSRNKPADKRALGRFLDHLKSDQGHVIIGNTAENLEITVLGQDASSAMPGGNVMKRLNDESGQALIISALCMTCLFGFAALAVDVGIMSREKRMAQSAADGAAVAGASELAHDWSGAAKAASALNGFTDGTNGVTVAVHNPPSIGPHSTDTSSVEVIVSKVQPTFFMKLFGTSSMTPTARAVATYGQTNGCIFTLGTSGTDISLVGNATISVTTCGVTDNSSDPSQALTVTGNAALLAAQSIGIVGGYTAKPDTLNPTPITGIVPVSDPLSSLPVPTVPTTCSADPNFKGKSLQTLMPGCYNGLTLGANANVSLSPGMYFINGGFNLGANSNLSGTGVTFDLLGATSMGGNANLNVSAPTTSGTYDGILFYQPSTNINPLSLTGTSSATLKGIIYAPSATVSLTGNAGANIYVDFVVNRLSLIGDASLQDYASINPGDVLRTIRLVE
jgi:Flp pilus assembly protein TadG